MSPDTGNGGEKTEKGETLSVGPGPDDEVSGEDAPEWIKDHWLRSRRARRLVWFDVGLTVALAIVAIGLFNGFTVLERLPGVGAGIEFAEDAFGVGAGTDDPTSEFSVGAISVIVFALLGALGYVFTVLITDIHRNTGRILRINFRVVGAIPIGFGVFLLSDYILDEVGIGTLGLVFLAGLYVNLTYKRLGSVADHLLPPESNEKEE